MFAPSHSKAFSILLVAIVLSGCFASKTAPGRPDSALIVDVIGQQVVLSTLNSAPQVAITKHKQSGGTLFIWYRTGVFITPANSVPIAPDVNNIVCANKLYRVLRTPDTVRLEQQ